MEEKRLDRSAQAAGIYATLCGLCAGFTFTATLFLLDRFSTLSNHDLYLGVLGVLTAIFINATICYSSTVALIAKNDIEKARMFYESGTLLARVGIFSLALTLSALIYSKSVVAGIVTLVSMLMLTKPEVVGVIFFDPRNYVGKYLRERRERKQRVRQTNDFSTKKIRTEG